MIICNKIYLRYGEFLMLNLDKIKIDQTIYKYIGWIEIMLKIFSRIFPSRFVHIQGIMDNTVSNNVNMKKTISNRLFLNTFFGNKKIIHPIISANIMLFICIRVEKKLGRFRLKFCC